jgi:hypothetical protein
MAMMDEDCNLPPPCHSASFLYDRRWRRVTVATIFLSILYAGSKISVVSLEDNRRLSTSGKLTF